MNMADNKIELLAPAGDMERLTMALTYGADAVYLAGHMFGMRAAAGNFSADELKTAVEMCRAKNAKIYVTCNSILRNDEISELPQFLEMLQEIGVDAVILADVGVLALTKKYAPKLQIHISTQAGVTNYETANAFYDLGASRVILARELTLEDIAEIRAKTPKELKIEAFAHGSMCVSFSGRCLLSNYMTGRDANRGECAQPCRWKYRLLEERNDEFLEISEDGGTHILNSRDMCMIDHIPEIIGAGIDSIKIEGRMKSAYYAAAVTNAYRHAVDAAIGGIELDAVWRNEVNMVSHREYSTGFYFDRNGPGQYYENALYFTDCDVVAIVEKCDSDGNAVLSQRNRFFKGDTLNLLTPNDKPVDFVVEKMSDKNDEEIDIAPHPMMEIKMKLPFQAPENSIVRKKRA